MGKSLVIVESPTKIKTLRKFLRKDFVFESSLGHIRDLPVKRFGIDVEKNFEPEYEVLPGKKEVIDRLKKIAKDCDVVYLAPDPDREGEAIAWHISELLPKKTVCKRVTFNSITREAVQQAIENPTEIDHALVNAQQARRLLDRIVGYKISPILSRKIQRGRDGFLSAGRVQSVALKLVVDREREIELFNPVEYWNLGSDLLAKGVKKTFRANLFSVDGLKVEKEPGKKKAFLISNETIAKEIAGKLEKAEYTVAKVEKKEKKRYPVPPFITSTLQQEASRHYGYTASRTMGIAQGLYEGLDMGNEGTEGLITYMRTDSTRIAPEAQKAAREFIQEVYGKEYLPPKSPHYASKKAAQDAHEAIRPTNLVHTPERVKPFLTDDQFKLYVLIWRRFLASQMNPAIYDTVSADIDTDQKLLLRANGSLIKFKGFLAIYEEKHDQEGEEEGDHLLPPIEVGDKLSLKDVLCTQAFTKPPPRFTEASLVKELEKSGIGRPSTYATIMNKIQSRDYTVKEKKALKPTELGKVICEMLESSFKMIMDLKFTAGMEEKLDSIAEDDKDWKKFIESFWTEFNPLVETASEEAFVPKKMTDRDCPKCGAKLQKIWAKRKYFYGCSNYPDCDFTSALDLLDLDKSEYREDFDWEQKCSDCGSDMTIRSGKFGIFLGCSKYPDCKGIVNIPKKGELADDDLPPCPAKGCPGKIVSRRSRFGKTFFACSTYPDCDVIANDLPTLNDKYKDHPRTAAKPKKKGATGKGRKQKGYLASTELLAIVKDENLTRGEITKRLWKYIKEHNLQDPNNKRLIVPDEKLAKIFGHNEPIDMMQLAGVISKHLS